MSLSCEQGWRPAFVNGRPTFDSIAIAPEDAQTDPVLVDEISDFVEPAVRDQADNIANSRAIGEELLTTWAG